MRILACLKKTFFENLREWKILILSLVFAPIFVYMMYGYFAAAAPAYTLLIINKDKAGGAGARSSDEITGLIAAWREAKHPDGKAMFTLVEMDDIAAARARIKSRDADLLIEIPEGFSRSLQDFRERKSETPARLKNFTDEKNMRGSMAMALSDYVAYSWATVLTAASIPMDVSLESLGSPSPLNDFDLYVPALLVLAIIMILFTAATSLIKEVDKGTMTRLMLSKLGTGELLTAISINQVFLGLVALFLTYLAALSCGYHSQGSITMLLFVGALTTLSVVAMSVVTAAFLKSMFELLTVGTFPFFILMFFSECMFPLPKITMLHLGSHTLYANDVLPTTLCVRAFNKILNYGATFSDIGFELIMIVLLTSVYFLVGTWLFRRRHQRI